MWEIYETRNVLEVLTEENKVFEVLVGYKGDKGDKGDTGTTAYEQAVEGGYTGTEAEFNTYIAMMEKLGLILTVGNGTMYLSNDGTYKEILIGSGGYSANLYFTTKNSDVTDYKKIEYIAETSETELSILCTTTEQLVRTYLYDFGIDTSVIDAGRWVSTYRAKVDSNKGARIRLEAFLRHTDNTETTLFSANSDLIINTAYATLKNETTQPLFNCATTDRLGFRLYASTTHPAGVTLNTIVGDGNASYITTPLSIRHNQLRDLNGDSNYLHINNTEKSGYDNASSKAHTQNTDDKLLSPDGTKTLVETDNSNNVTFNGNIIQTGTTYETHAEKLYTKKDKIITRDGAVSGLATGEYTGIQATLYDGVNNGYLVFDKDGIARVGDVGSLQALATREDTPLNNGVAKWNNSTLRFETFDLNPLLPYFQTKTTIDATLVLGTIYQLGTLTGNLSFALPNPVGVTTQEIALMFNLDSNLRTITITGTNFYPSTLTLAINTGYIVRIVSDGTKWVVGKRSFIKA